MNFTYDGYRKMITNLRECGYKIRTYRNWEMEEQCVVLRHDIDNSIEKALRLAEIEKQEGVISTYFVLLTSDFYNVFSKKNKDLLHKIQSYGHNIGLHFDETSHRDITTPDDVVDRIFREAELLGMVLGEEVKEVSMHRPSKMFLDADLRINKEDREITNSYSQLYFKEFKFISDSRRRWREPVKEIINNKLYNKLHILTHAIWYNDVEKDLRCSVLEFLKNGSQERYITLSDNITDLSSIIKREEIC